MLNYVHYSLKVTRPNMILVRLAGQESPDTIQGLTSNRRWMKQMTVPQKRKLARLGGWKMQRGDDPA